MVHYLLEIGAAVYLVIIGSMVAGLLRAAKAGVHLAGQILDQQQPMTGDPRSEFVVIERRRKP